MEKKSLQKLGAAAIVLLIAALVSGCGAPSAEQGAADSLEYEVIEETGELPENISEPVEKLKVNQGYFPFDPQEYETGNNFYLLISAGEKPTGGYEISLESVISDNDRLKIEVSEKTPAEDEMVTQALTYPWLVLRLNKTFHEHEVTGEDGVSYELLELDENLTPSEDSGKNPGMETGAEATRGKLVIKEGVFRG